MCGILWHGLKSLDSLSGVTRAANSFSFIERMIGALGPEVACRALRRS
jgi:hypothetical protein